MVLQHKTRLSLWDLMESQVGGNVLEKAIQTKPPTPPSIQALRPDPANHKRKRDKKSKEMVEEEKSHSSKEAEPQRGLNKSG